MIDLDNTLMYKTLLKILRHDTRNTFVKLDSLLKELPNSSVTGMIEDSIQELKDLISSSTGFIEGEKKIVSLYDLVSNLCLTDKKINLTNHKRIKFEHDPQIYLFVEVSELFSHAILNIVENALKYSPEEEIVSVKITREVNQIVITVTDKGIGIPFEFHQKVFQQGFRTEKAKSGFEGTGTGLWITRNIILNDHGTVSVEENRDGGSIFKVTIPIFFTESLEKSIDRLLSSYIKDPVELSKCLESVKTLIDLHEPPSEYHYDSLIFANLYNYIKVNSENKERSHFKDRLTDIKSKNPDGKTIVIVDDSTYVHYYLGSFFTELGYRIVDFGYNGQEGFNLYEKHNPDLITLDITMPIMSGIEASEKIVSTDKNANILFLSGLGSHEGLLKVLESSLADQKYEILTKPFTIDDLRECLSNFNL